MLAEGVTIKPARVVCYATNVTEDLPFKQIVTRASRKENFQQKGAGSIWMPADQRLIECAKNVDGMNLSMVSKTDQKSHTNNTGIGSYTFNEYKFISSRLDKEFGIYSGETVSEEQLGLARATISEHLTKIEGILMDDMFSSMTDVRLTVEQARTIVETMELDMDEEETYQTESFAGLIKRIKENIAEELPSDTENVPELDIRQDPEEILKRIQEDIS